MASLRIIKLSQTCSVDDFACGNRQLDDYLKRYALQNQAAGAASVYVATNGERAYGYYTLHAAHVEHAGAPERLKKGLARHPVPVILIGRLAVDSGAQGKGLGAALLRDALFRVLGAADIIGARAILVHAKDESARRFYEHFNFEPSPVDPLQLFLLVKDIRRLLES